MTDTIPFGNSSNDSVILAEGYQMKWGESLVSPSNIVVSAGYFQALRIPLIAGRFPENSDTEDSQRVIIVDDRLARKFWPGISPVGRRMWRPTSTQNLIKPDPCLILLLQLPLEMLNLEPGKTLFDVACNYFELGMLEI